MPPCVPGRTKIDNILLAAGFYNGTLIDFTYSMMQIHQGRDTYHNSVMKDTEDVLYNRRLPTKFAKLRMAPYSVYRGGHDFVLGLTDAV